MSGRTVLITGGATRIGRAMALHLASQGYDIVIHYHRSVAEVAPLLEELHQIGVAAICYQADFTDTEQVIQMMPDLVMGHGPIWGLIHNACHFVPDRFAEFDPAIFATHFQINVSSSLLLSQAFAVQFREHFPAEAAMPPGNIIHMLDWGMDLLPRKFLSYTLSKQTLWTLTQLLAVELAPHIRVNAVAPGYILPESRLSGARFEHMAQENLMAQPASLSSICETICFLLSMSDVTGQMLRIDGGRHLMNVEYC